MQIPRVTHALCKLVRRHGFKAIVGTYSGNFPITGGPWMRPLQWKSHLLPICTDTVAEAMANKGDAAFPNGFRKTFSVTGGKNFCHEPGDGRSLPAKIRY